MPHGSRLLVLLDGVALDEASSRDIWLRFSRHMDDHEGDLEGFASAHGYHRVSPEAREGKAVLVIWTREPTREQLARTAPAPARARTEARATPRRQRKGRRR